MAKKQTNNNLERTGFILSHLSNPFGFDAVSMWAEMANKDNQKHIEKGVKNYVKSKKRK